MDIHHLVKMANEIGSFFQGSCGPTEAAGATAEHLKKFWEPRMRREIIAYLRQTGGGGLSEVARNAVALLEREEMEQVAR